MFWVRLFILVALVWTAIMIIMTVREMRRDERQMREFSRRRREIRERTVREFDLKPIRTRE